MNAPARFLALAATMGFASVALAGPSLSGADAKFAQEYKPGEPGAVAIAARACHPAFSRAYGLANVETATPMTAASVLRIASLTKQFTAVAVLALVEEGKLKLDQTVGSVWPEAPEIWRTLTLRELMSHTSGISDDMTPVFSKAMQDFSPDQLLALFADAPMAAKPGEAWRYSNVNYWILGKVIETVSGKSYAEFVRGRVLVPAMTRTRYGSHSDIIPGRAGGYERAGAAWTNARYFSQTIGYSAGGFVSTPEDMAAWYCALGRGEIVSMALLDIAFTEVKTADGKPTGYGLGWYVSRVDAQVLVHHGGSTVGFASYVYWLPGRGIFAGVLENRSGDGEPSAQARFLLDAATADSGFSPGRN